MGRLGSLSDGRDVGPQPGRVVGVWVVRPRCLILAEQVDREHPAPGGGELGEHREEIFLAARKARDEQGSA